MILSCVSVMWVSNADTWHCKVKFVVTGGMLMNIIEIVNDVIVGAGCCGISHR
jgi:hypothetical protein